MDTNISDPVILSHPKPADLCYILILSQQNSMKVTLITGASGGIGEAFARRLAAERHNLLLIARSENKLRVLCDELMREHKITAQYIAIDLVSPDADRIIFEETEKRDLEVDFLINNAGIGSAGDFSSLELKSELEMITLNISALVALTHRFIQKMRYKKGGTIINVASLAAFQPCPYMAAYAASKVFVRSFTEAIAEENRPYNIRIVLLCPGATETNFFDAANVGGSDKNTLVGTSLETPEMVVESAMRGLSGSKTIIISGFKNLMMARMGYLVPNSFITKTLAKSFRPTFERNK